MNLRKFTAESGIDSSKLLISLLQLASKIKGFFIKLYAQTEHSCPQFSKFLLINAELGVAIRYI